MVVAITEEIKTCKVTIIMAVAITEEIKTCKVTIIMVVVITEEIKTCKVTIIMVVVITEELKTCKVTIIMFVVITEELVTGRDIQRELDSVCWKGCVLQNLINKSIVDIIVNQLYTIFGMSAASFAIWSLTPSESLYFHSTNLLHISLGLPFPLVSPGSNVGMGVSGTLFMCPIHLHFHHFASNEMGSIPVPALHWKSCFANIICSSSLPLL